MATKPSVIKDLKGLKAVKLEIETRARQQAEQQAARLAAARKAQAEKELFARAIGPVEYSGPT